MRHKRIRGETSRRFASGAVLRTRQTTLLALALPSARTSTVWWQIHKDMSMREVQIEVLVWTIAQAKQDSKAYPAEQINRLNDDLTKMLTSLRNSATPLPPSWPFAK